MKRLVRFLGIVPLTILALVLLGLQGTTRESSAQTIPVEPLLNRDGTLNLAAGWNGALDLQGWNVMLDSKRGPVLTRAEQGRTVSLNECVSALPHDGLDSYISALAVMGGDLYVGGYFTQTADGAVTDLNNIAKFDGTNWLALPNHGLESSVNALAVIGSDLYVGGQFTRTKDGVVTNLNNIAKFDGTNWLALPHQGLNQLVYAFAVSSPPGGGAAILYVGGDFTETADGAVTSLNGIAKFRDTSWSALPHSGLNDYVNTLAVSGSDLYVGGAFTQTQDTTVTNLNHIAKFSGGAWSALPNHGLNNEVYTLAASSSSGADPAILYAGGIFTQTTASALALNHIAKFSGGVWSALPHNGLDGEVYGLAVSGKNLYAGGRFFETTDGAVTNLNNLAKFDGGNWSVFPHNGLNNDVYGMAVTGGDLYVFGPFTGTDDGAVMNLNAIAKYPKPAKPALKSPANTAHLSTARPTLKWNAANCTDTYQVIVKNATTGKTGDKKAGLTVLKYKTDPLAVGETYKWFVKACNILGCTKSATRTFTLP